MAEKNKTKHTLWKGTVQSLWEDNITFCTFKSLPSSSNNTNTYNVPFAVRNVHVPFSGIKRYACNTLRSTRDLCYKHLQKRSVPVVCLSPSCSMGLYSTFESWCKGRKRFEWFSLSFFLSFCLWLSLCHEIRRHDCNIYNEISLRAHKAH